MLPVPDAVMPVAAPPNDPGVAMISRTGSSSALCDWPSLQYDSRTPLLPTGIMFGSVPVGAVPMLLTNSSAGSDRVCAAAVDPRATARPSPHTTMPIRRLIHRLRIAVGLSRAHDARWSVIEQDHRQSEKKRKPRRAQFLQPVAMEALARSPEHEIVDGTDR